DAATTGRMFLSTTTAATAATATAVVTATRARKFACKLLSWKNIVLFHPPTAASHCRDPLSDAATMKGFLSTTTAAAAATATTATLAATVTRPRRLACN
ncbi:hypothetical protein DFQ27_002762, partial [Actinomortierella ambigua]